jgi:hypothetical protein
MFSRIGAVGRSVERQPEFRFARPTDGTIERKLKASLSERLRGNPNVTAAYLARIRRSGSAHDLLALCVRTEVGPDQHVVRLAHDVCGSVGIERPPVEVIFLSAGLERDLCKTCTPFFSTRGG